MGKFYAFTNNEEIFTNEQSFHIVNCGYERLERNIHYKRKRPDYYLVFMVAGTATFYLNKTKHNLTKGKIFLYSPNDEQEYLYNVKNNPYVYWVHFMGEAADKLMEKLELQSGEYDLSNEQDVFVLLNEIVNEYKIMSRYYEEYAIGMLYRLLTIIGRQIKNVEKNDVFINVIEKIYAEPLTSNETLAKICNFSTMHFIRKFQKQYGMTPLKFKQRILMDKAKGLLENEMLTVTQIALTLGFENNPLYFNKLFKSHTGMSPCKYRENIKKK